MNLYESTRQTPFYRNTSDEIESAYHQRFLDATDGREFGPPEDVVACCDGTCRVEAHGHHEPVCTSECPGWLTCLCPCHNREPDPEAASYGDVYEHSDDLS